MVRLDMPDSDNEMFVFNLEKDRGLAKEQGLYEYFATHVGLPIRGLMSFEEFEDALDSDTHEVTIGTEFSRFTGILESVRETPFNPEFDNPDSDRMCYFLTFAGRTHAVYVGLPDDNYTD